MQPTSSNPTQEAAAYKLYSWTITPAQFIRGRRSATDVRSQLQAPLQSHAHSKDSFARE